MEAYRFTLSINCTGGMHSWVVLLSTRDPFGYPSEYHIILGCESTPPVLITLFTSSFFLNNAINRPILYHKQYIVSNSELFYAVMRNGILYLTLLIRHAVLV